MSARILPMPSRDWDTANVAADAVWPDAPAAEVIPLPYRPRRQYLTGNSPDHFERFAAEIRSMTDDDLTTQWGIEAWLIPAFRELAQS
jgi:hypothetical protein